MVKNIVKDVLFLQRKSIEATKEDAYIGKELKDTLKANQDRCVGMAANMIGYSKRIIIVNMGLVDVLMYNPKLINKKEPYEVMEGCLSLTGQRKATRYKEITVKYLDENFVWQTNVYKGFIAQIIQHELDHLEGIII